MAFERLKEFKDINIDIDCVAGATLYVYTNSPGGVMVARNFPLGGATSLALPATSGRQTIAVALDNLKGTLIKFKITSTGVVILYAAVLRVKAIGTYFDGSQAEIWQTQELGFGI